MVMARASISAAGMRIMRLLIGHPPQKMADLIEATGVTRTAITEQLNELIAAGYVEQSIERLPGRGRPRYLYAATEKALTHLFEGNQNLVVPAIWRAIDRCCGHDSTEKVADQVAEELANHFRKQMISDVPQERIREFVQLVSKDGRLVEFYHDNDEVLVHKLNCPFISMYDDSGMVCKIHQMAMCKLCGAKMVQIACRHEGAPCCVFKLELNGEVSGSENADSLSESERSEK
jgi:predicted ArsR family transcriptional regulator